MSRYKFNYYRPPKPPESLEIINLNYPVDSGGYPDFKFFFPNEEQFNPLCPLGQKIKAIETHLMENEQQQINFHLSIAENDRQFLNAWPEFKKELNESSSITMNILNISLCKIRYDPKLPKTFQQHQINIIDFKPESKIEDLDEELFDQFISIRGIVLRTDEAEGAVDWLAFECEACHSRQVVRQPAGCYKEPTKCVKPKAGGTCKNHSEFIPLKKSSHTKIKLIQRISIQQLSNDIFSSNIPKTLEINLWNNLTDKIEPGDDITISGILRINLQNEQSDKPDDREIYLEAFGLKENKKEENEEDDTSEEEIIREIKNHSNTYRLLVHSLCPQIYGHEMVKAGLILALFGGVSTEQVKRNQIHCLMIGEPGLGKSEMLQACRKITPKGVFVSGQSTSKVGLTCKVKRESNDKGYLEAGALVTASDGNCFIDELDKMSAQHSALLEVMEHQRVSIAKAGACCTIPAKTSVIAAANPVGGSYDQSKSVSENLRMSPSLLTRFDLVFILLDTSNARQDGLRSIHNQKAHNKSLKSKTTITDFFDPVPVSSASEIFDCQDFEKNLCLKHNEIVKPICNENFQKYIAHAKRHHHPDLSIEAKEAISTFYLQLRKTSVGTDSIEVTPRQLEAAIRLSQARARIDLCNIVSIDHANDIIAIMKYSMLDVFLTENNHLDISRNINGSGMSNAKQCKIFLQKIQQVVQMTNNKKFDEKELIEIGQKQLGPNVYIKGLIDSLNIQSYILRTSNGKWSLNI